MMDLKGLSKKYQTEIYLMMFLILVGIISFNLGRIWTVSRYGQLPKVEQANISEIFKNSDKKQETSGKLEENTNKLEANQLISFEVVGSKNSSKYHYKWCSGAKLIKPENLISFNSEQEAQAKGYTLAKNCNK